MSSLKATRSALDKLKSGNRSDEDDSDDYYNEEEQDNYSDLDDFVINDQDVGYNARSHQKQQQSFHHENPNGSNNNKSNLNRNNNRARHKYTNQASSYNISRRRNRNKQSNDNHSKSIANHKTQSSMNSFLTKSNKNNNTNNHRSKKVNKNNRKQKIEKKNKKTSQPKNNNFMSDILADMDSDADNNNIDDNNDNDLDMMPSTNLNETFMNDDEMMDDDIDIDNNNLTEAQTQYTMNNNTQQTVQTHMTQTQIMEKDDEHEINHEPPRKMFKFSSSSNNVNKNDTKSGDIDINEGINDKMKEMEIDDNDNKENDETSTFPTMFNKENINRNNGNRVNEKNENTDNYPAHREGYINFFWFDAYEDPIKRPGQIYLFGKTLNPKINQWQSVCIFIKNIDRTMYVLPRLKNKNDDYENGERVDFMAVYQELEQKRKRLGITKFAALPIDKKYCFNERGNGIPSIAKYLKIQYSFNHPPFIGNGFQTGTTYSKIFGIRSTALELFILDHQIMGPCWLQLPFKKASRKVSWCKIELEFDYNDMENDNNSNIRLLSTNYPSPKFKVLSLSFQTIFNNKKEHEIAAISGVIHNNVCLDHKDVNNKNDDQTQNNEIDDYFTYIRKIDRNPFPYDLERELKGKNFNPSKSFKSFSTERELLNFLTTRLQAIDADVIVGHKLYDFLLDVMLNRMDKLKINHWSRIGRLRRSQIPFIRGGTLNRKYLGCGRLFVDTFLSSQEFIHESNYTLSYLVKQLLGFNEHKNLNPNDIKKQWFDGKDLAKIICHCCNDANLVSKLMFKLQILPLTKELTNLCGNLWSRSLTSQRAERNEWLLLHEFYNNGFIVPERLTRKEKIAKGIISEKSGNRKKRQKAQYSGGLVLEPIKGLYDKYVLCLDFNSLYPSIVQEYNLCFTSVAHWKYSDNKLKKEGGTAGDNNYVLTEMQKSISVETGILPKVIGVLLSRRTQVKKILKSTKIESEKTRLDIQQKALKLVANSMYGCLGFTHSRFYCKPIASLITALGRESLMKASQVAQSLGNLKVIYGDTDSIFIYTDCDNLIKARNFATDIKKKVNKTYKNMYLELDYVFSKMLLLRKKKYAANKVISFKNNNHGEATNIVTKKEIKGLGTVRRDWSIISKEIGKKVLDVILTKNKQIDDVIIGVQELLQHYKQLFDENKIELKKFIITKKLTKKPSDYPDATKQPHVMVALQMQKLGMNVNVGSFIEYIICKQLRDGANNNGSKSLAQRAYHIDEITKSMQNTDKSKILEVDRLWYLEQQILPPIGRYCSPIEGTDIGHLANALGLDSKKFHHLNRSSNNNGNNVLGNNDDDDDEEKILSITNPLKRYRDRCEPLKIKCKHCKTTYNFSGVFDFNNLGRCGLICATSNCKGIISLNKDEAILDIKCIKNHIQLQIWKYVNQYYAREWICVDQTCNYRTRQLPLSGIKCPKIGCSASMKESYKASDLFDQLRYFSFLFDVNEQRKILKQEKEHTKSLKDELTKQQIESFNIIHQWIKDTVLKKSRYYFIDSKVIFKYLL